MSALNGFVVACAAAASAFFNILPAFLGLLTQYLIILLALAMPYVIAAGVVWIFL